MKHCNHSYWLSLRTRGKGVALLESNRLRTLIGDIPHPETRHPSLFVLIGNKEKSLVLHKLFGVKRSRRFTLRRKEGEVHLHLEPSSIFSDRPILIADGDLSTWSSEECAGDTLRCHETARRPLLPGLRAERIVGSVYPQLLLPFTDVFCFFSADIGGLRQVACYLAAWIERGHSSTLPKSTYPRVVIVTDEIPPGTGIEKEARKTFLSMLNEETTKDPFEKLSEIKIVTLLQCDTMSVATRYRRVKECLLNMSDYVRKAREDSRTMFSATHFVALFEYACRHFTRTSEEPFNFITASRRNPIAPDLGKHLSTFLELVRNSKQLTDFAVCTIASSFLLDTYPPEAHRK